jgi:Holliday junction resolvasome RuvABC endonuclease subunit
MNEEVILAIDGSTKNTGWSIFHNKELKEHGVIGAGSANLYHRIDKMVEEIKKIIDKYKPTRVVMEEVLPEDVKNNNNVFKALIYLQGFLMKLFDENKLQVELVTASHWRKCCGIKTGSGIRRDSLKPKDIQFVKKTYDLNVNDDEADAICIGWSVTHDPLPVIEEEIIKDSFGFEFG